MCPFILFAFSILVSIPGLTVAQDFRIGTWNLEWFFDHNTSDDSSQIGPQQAAPSEAEYRERVTDVANAIKSMNLDILALQEIENKKVAQDIAYKLEEAHGLEYKVEFVQGVNASNGEIDTFTGQDVAFLLKQNLPSSAKRFTYTTATGPKNISKHLRLETTWAGETIVLVTVHLITNTTDRIQQAQTLRTWLNDESGNIIVLGDFNTGLSPNNTPPTSEMGIIQGLGTAATSDDLFDLHPKLSVSQRETHVSEKAFDRIVASFTLVDVLGLRVDKLEQFRSLAIKGTPDQGGGVDYPLPNSEQDVSDHFPLVVTLTTTGTSRSGQPDQPRSRRFKPNWMN